jgi:hypothetical protein
MKVFELPAETKAATGFTHKAVLDHVDLTDTTTSGTQSFTLLTIPAKSVVRSVAMHLKTPFKETADATNNELKLIVGDATNDDRFLKSVELNENGTEVLVALNPPNVVPHVATAATAVIAKFTPKTGENLALLNVGEVNVFFEIIGFSSL